MLSENGKGHGGWQGILPASPALSRKRPRARHHLSIAQIQSLCLSRGVPIIVLDGAGFYPSASWLDRVSSLVQNESSPIAYYTFLYCLTLNKYTDYDNVQAVGPAVVRLNGSKYHVWAYHTFGWSGNEAIIDAISESLLWEYFLEIYERGGHYYFTLPEHILACATEMENTQTGR